MKTIIFKFGLDKNQYSLKLRIVSFAAFLLRMRQMDVLFLISLYLYTCILTDAIQIRFMTFKDYCLLFFITITISSLSSSCTFSIETDLISHHIVILRACNVVSTNNIVLSVTPIFYQSKRSFYLLLLHFTPYHSCYYLLSNSNNMKYCTTHYQILGFT